MYKRKRKTESNKKWRRKEVEERGEGLTKNEVRKVIICYEEKGKFGSK